MRQWTAHTSGIWALAFAPDSRRLATAARGEVAVWDPADGRCVARIPAPMTFSAACCFLPDGRLIVGAGGIVRFCPPPDFVPRAERKLADHPPESRGIQAVESSPDGRWLIAGLLGRLFRLRLDDPTVTPVEWHLGGTNALYHSFTTDGRLLATTRDGGEVVIWNTADWSERRVLTESGNRPVSHGIGFRPGSRQLAVSQRDGSVRVWNADAGETVWSATGHHGYVLQAVWDPCGRMLATCGQDGTIRLWDGNTGRERACFDWGTGQLNRMAFAPDGLTLAAVSTLGQVVIQDAEG
jgi:WD40 repeat protein